MAIQNNTAAPDPVRLVCGNWLAFAHITNTESNTSIKMSRELEQCACDVLELCEAVDREVDGNCVIDPELARSAGKLARLATQLAIDLRAAGIRLATAGVAQ